METTSSFETNIYNTLMNNFVHLSFHTFLIILGEKLLGVELLY